MPFDYFSLENAEALFGFTGLGFVGLEEPKIKFPVPQRLIATLDYLCADEVADAYRTMDSTAEIEVARKNTVAIKNVTAEMKKIDFDVADEIISCIDARTLSLLRDFCVPDGDLFDPSDPKNVTRGLLLKMLDEIEPPVKHVATGQLLFLKVEDTYETYVGSNLVVQSEYYLDHIEHVLQNYPKLFVNLYRQISNLVPQRDKKYWTSENCARHIRQARMERALSKSMNKFTKVSQLVAVDQDNPFFWFDKVIHDGPVYYVGKVDPRALLRFPNAVQISSDEIGMLGEDDLLLADLVRGDSFSGHSNDENLYNQLLKVCGTCVVVAHAYLVGIKGELMKKPRPHNLTGIVYLNVDTLSSLDYILDSVSTANEDRNLRYVDRKMGAKLLPLYKDVGEILDDLAIVTTWPSYEPTNRSKKKRATRSKLFEKRQETLMTILHDKNYFVGNRWAVLDVEIKPGPVLQSIPSYGDPDFVVASVFRAATARGFKAYFNGQWCFTKM